MSIIEKLGIPEIVEYIEDRGFSVCNVKPVRELEQQRNGMLEALIRTITEDEEHPIPCDDGSCDVPNGCDCYVNQIVLTIEKADPQHRTWEEIKELLNDL